MPRSPPPKARYRARPLRAPRARRLRRPGEERWLACVFLRLGVAAPRIQDARGGSSARRPPRTGADRGPRGRRGDRARRAQDGPSESRAGAASLARGTSATGGLCSLLGGDRNGRSEGRELGHGRAHRGRLDVRVARRHPKALVAERLGHHVEPHVRATEPRRRRVARVVESEVGDARAPKGR